MAAPWWGRARRKWLNSLARPGAAAAAWRLLMGVRVHDPEPTMNHPDCQHSPSDESPTLYFSPLSQLPQVRALAADPALLRQIAASDRAGQVALGSGDVAGAERAFAASLELRQRGNSEAQAGLPQAFGRLAVVALRRGQGHRARDLFELGLDIARALRTQLSVDDAMLLQNLGYIARMAGDLDEAERCYASALSIKLLAVGELHPTVATTLCSQGMVLLRRDLPAAALEKFARARQIHEAATGTLSAGLGHVHMGSGSALLRLGRFAEAERSFGQALAVHEALPVARTVIARSRFFLARARWHRDPVGARGLAEQALGEYSRDPRSDPRPLAIMRAWLARRALAAA